MDAHEKYRWLNLIHHKAMLANELVCEADKVWRRKLEHSLAEEIEEKKIQLAEEVSNAMTCFFSDVNLNFQFLCIFIFIFCSPRQWDMLNIRLKRRDREQVHLLKQGVAFYETALVAMHKGDITPDELYRSTGWTEEHYQNFKRRVKHEDDRADFRRKKTLDTQAHKHSEIIEELKNSLR